MNVVKICGEIVGYCRVTRSVFVVISFVVVEGISKEVNDVSFEVMFNQF